MPYIIIFKIEGKKISVEIDRPNDGFLYKGENEEIYIYSNEILFQNSTKKHVFNIYMNDDTLNTVIPGSFIVVLKCNVKNVEVKGKYIWNQILKLLPLQVN